MKNKEYYSLAETGEKLGISRIAVYNRVKKGNIKAIRIGRSYAVPKTSSFFINEEEEKSFIKDEIVIYKQKDGYEIDVRLKKNNIWLTQKQIASLFDIKRPAITKHIKNIFDEKELDEVSVRSFLEHTAKDGKKYKTGFYNLDIIIAVGYRVNSKKATQFRQWATNVLKDHLVKGYTINEKRLVSENRKLKELEEVVKFITSKAGNDVLKGSENSLFMLLDEYTKALSILDGYDGQNLKIKGKKKVSYILGYDECKKVVEKAKIKDKNKSMLFGRERDEKLKDIIGNIHQTFDKKELYKTIDEKAAHFLYFLVKDHPFTDGNKRIAAILFVYYLDANGHLKDKKGFRRFDNNTLAVITLLIAISDPKEKETMIKIVTNILN